MKAPLPSEHAMQAAVIDWWRLACRGYGLPEFALFAIPNAAKRSFRLAAYMRAEGMRAGVPDLLLAFGRWDRWELRGLFIEMKRKPNKVTPEQTLMIEYLLSEGYRVKVCWSSEEAIATIKDYLR